MLVVLDTNIIVSGLISGAGPPGHLLDAWMDHQFELLTSTHQMVELARVLGYSRIASRLSPERVSSLIRNMQIAMLVEPAVGIALSPDPDDNVILATAIAGGAELIVSGDKRHMITLGSANGIPIITARHAVQQLVDRDADAGTSSS